MADLIPSGVGKLKNPQTALPRIARDPKLTAAIEDAVRRLPTRGNDLQALASQVYWLSHICGSTCHA